MQNKINYDISAYWHTEQQIIIVDLRQCATELALGGPTVDKLRGRH
jgi:hypothetical protein